MRTPAKVTLRPRWRTQDARELLAHTDLAIEDHAFGLSAAPCEVGVVHCIDV